MGWIANCSVTKSSSIRSGKRLRRFIAASKITDDSPVKYDNRTVAVQIQITNKLTLSCLAPV